MRYYLTFLVFVLNILNVFGQEYTAKYRDLPPNVMNKYFYVNKTDEDIKTLFDKGVKLVNYLPKGYLKRGSVDYTEIFQMVLNKNKIIILPDFPILINEEGLMMNNDQTVVFQKNSELLMRPNSRTHYSLIRIVNVKNITLINPNLKGDRLTHKGKGGQWGMGILIQGGENIKIINPIISHFWGDGIYIGGFKGLTSRNIEISEARIDYNRRNGISITSANGVKIINPIISNSTGIPPMAGIDIEPNSNSDEINNIDIINPITFYNTRYGIALALGRLPGKIKKTVNINIINHTDYGSRFGLTLPALKRNSSNYYIDGTVNILNSLFYDSGKHAIKPVEYFDFNLKLNLNSFKIFRTNKYGVVFEDLKLEDNILKNLKEFKKIKIN